MIVTGSRVVVRESRLSLPLLARFAKRRGQVATVVKFMHDAYDSADDIVQVVWRDGSKDSLFVADLDLETVASPPRLIDRRGQFEVFPIGATKRFVFLQLVPTNQPFPHNLRGLLVGEGDTAEEAKADAAYRGNSHLIREIA